VRVEEVMTSPVFINCLDHATKARAIMRREGLRILIVVDEDGMMEGVLKRGDVINITFTRTLAKAKDIMSPPRALIYPDEDALRAVEKMLGAGEWYSPVVERDAPRRVVGILGLEHVIVPLIEKNPSPLEISVSEVMAKNPVHCRANDSVLDAWHKMQGHDFAGLPVVNERGVVVGMITQLDILSRSAGQLEIGSPSGRHRQPPKVYKIMKSPAITVKTYEPLLKAAKIMVERDFGRVPVTDDHDLLVGIVDREDVIKRYLC